MLSGAKSDSMVQSQVCCGRPDWRFQSLGKGTTQDPRARLWSIARLAHAMPPKNLRRVVPMMCVSGGGWSVQVSQSHDYGNSRYMAANNETE